MTPRRPSVDQNEQHRFPDVSFKCDAIQNQVLDQIASGKNPEDYLEFVRFLLHKAPELVKDFEDIATKFGRGAMERRQQTNSSQNPDINLRRSSALFATPTLNHANAFSTRAANTNITPSVLPPSLANPSAPRKWPSNENFPSNSTQDFQDDCRQDDVQNLLVLSEVNIPPRQRKKTPNQMSCALTEHQKIGLTWLLEQENDRKKKGGLLAGMSHI